METQELFVSTDVIFHENKFSFKRNNCADNESRDVPSLKVGGANHLCNQGAIHNYVIEGEHEENSSNEA